MQALEPETVRLENLPALPEPLRNADWAIVDYLTFMGEPTPERTIHPQDDPRRADPEHGRAIIAQAVDQIVKRVQEELKTLPDR